MTPPAPLVPETDLEELGRLGRIRYDGLRAHLEPAQDGHFVAIHVDSGDWEVAHTSAQATRALQSRRPLDGRLYVRRIGPEPEWGLVARLLAGEMMEAARK